MATVPPRGGPRSAPIISPILLADQEQRPADAAQALLIDDQNRQMVLAELRRPPGMPITDVRTEFLELFQRVFRRGNIPPQPVPVGQNYMRCVLTPDELVRLVRGGARTSTAKAAQRAMQLIYRVWPDLVVEGHLDRSVTTIKADAAVRTYGCNGNSVVWGVLDSGIDAQHPHFAAMGNLSVDAVKALHRDFTITPGSGDVATALVDPVGHGTHVAGIIAGRAPADPKSIRIATNEPTAMNLPQWCERSLPAGSGLSGVAPSAGLVSLKVLDENNKTMSSVVIDALSYVRDVNSGGRDLRIHGVNLSLGCSWVPSDYAAGQSPLCRELDLLVGTGVVAVVSAGNSGARGQLTGQSSDVYGQLSTITDPGNAAGAITVGSVHRYRPHTYGVTFDSSKGPTLDGRTKPDVVAPGERITSAAAGSLAAAAPPLAPRRGDPANLARYIEDSGTSMAAAHVSGMIAAFLSARTEFIGQPQLVKKLLTDTATDLGRHVFFQGAGLVDLMRALSNT